MKYYPQPSFDTQDALDNLMGVIGINPDDYTSAKAMLAAAAQKVRDLKQLASPGPDWIREYHEYAETHPNYNEAELNQIAEFDQAVNDYNERMLRR